MRSWLAEVMKGGGTAVLCTLLALGVSECNRNRSSREVQQRIADDTVKRIRRDTAYLGLMIYSLRQWAIGLSKEQGIQPPMDLPGLDEFPLEDRRMPSPPPWAGAFAAELGPPEEKP
jgi:hypothetical protein